MLDGFLTEKQLATKLKRTTRTLRIWRAKGIGPAYTRAGTMVLYRDQALREWLLHNEVQPVRTKCR